MRRIVLLALLSMMPQTSRDAAPQPSGSLIVDVTRVPDEVIPIWPGAAPGGERVHVSERVDSRANPFNLPDRAATGITRPTLSMFRAAHPDGSAILIAPGGGFDRVVIEKEGWESARWFSTRGAAVYVMTYRLPQDGWAAGPDTPLQDAQRAIRVIRERASRDGVDPHRVMVMGFSAGGYVLGSLTTRFADKVYQPLDAADAMSARPDASVLVYPVATMQAPYAHAGSRGNLLGASPTPAQSATYSLETSPPADAPPVFLLHAGDDTSVPVENSLALYAALKKAGTSAELHIFERGGHGFGMRGLDDNPARVWPQLVMDFGMAHGIFGRQ